MIKINVLGSCVSRVSLLDGVQSAHGVSDDRLDLGYFLDKQNIVCAMLPAPFSPEEVDTITVDELDDKSRLHSLKQCLNKSTVPMLLESDAEYLVMDFYDMGINFCTYENTMFATQANEFCQTALYRKYADKIGANKVVILGQKEIDTGEFVVKNLRLGSECSMSANNLIKYLKLDSEEIKKITKTYRD